MEQAYSLSFAHFSVYFQHIITRILQFLVLTISAHFILADFSNILAKGIER